MITKTTNLDSQYMDLFEEIAEKSQGSIKVENLEQFFGSIQEIADLDPKFLRLPLDEPMFEIDANSRKINVDATPFKANGLAVQGDHLAETVFFKIDRYYDTMDLMNTDIYVNWKMGSASGRDKCSIKSDSIISGYIVFAWPIHDKITSKGGSLQFAIELNISQEGKNGYALNTIPATLNIKEGLVLVNPEVLDMQNNIKSILINSSFGDGTAAVGEVKWATGNGAGLVKDLNGEFAEVINLKANVDPVTGALSSVPVTLYALAAAGRDAIIMYSDSNKIPIKDPAYVALTAESVINDDVVYYIKETDGVYQVATSEQIAAFGTENEVPLFVAVAEVELNKVGSYSVNAQGVKYDTIDKDTRVKIGASALVECHPVRVPEADTPVEIHITAPAQEYNPQYSFVDGTDAIFLAENANLELSASATMPNNDYGLLSFVWKKDNEEEAVQDNGFSDVNLSTLEIASEGSYTVEVKHYRNGDTIKSIVSEPCLVSYFASPLSAEIQPITDNCLTLEKAPKSGYSKGAQGTVKIEYEFETINPYSSEIKFELIFVESEESEKVVPATFAKEADGIEVCTINSANLPDEGKYYFKVYNIYNGSIFHDVTSKFNIDIKD